MDPVEQRRPCFLPGESYNGTCADLLVNLQSALQITAKAAKPALAIFEPLVVKTTGRSKLVKWAFLFGFG